MGPLGVDHAIARMQTDRRPPADKLGDDNEGESARPRLNEDAGQGAGSRGPGATAGRSAVHCGQRCAGMGIFEQQSGQSFVGGGGAAGAAATSRFIPFTRRKAAKATMTKFSTAFAKTP